jgi:SAM-dependent methyltransferase
VTRPAVVVGDATLPAEQIEDQLRDDRGITIPPGRWGLEPYPMPEFARLLAVALAVPGLPGWPVFCDIGAGCGVKVLMAAEAGCRAYGVEAVKAYQEAAAGLGATVVLGEAEEQDYSAVDIALVNCPYRNPQLEAAFEDAIRAALRPGVVLISVNHCRPPSGWQVVLDEPDRDRGIYVKPFGG